MRACVRAYVCVFASCVQLPLAENNPPVRVTYFGVAYSEPLLSPIGKFKFCTLKIMLVTRIEDLS